MANNILVFIEQRNGQIKKASYEAAKVASELAQKLNCGVHAILLGSAVADAANVGLYGINKVTFFQNENLLNYSSAYADIVSQYAAENNFNILILSNTSLGKDIAPKLAIKANAGIAVDCIDLKVDGEDIVLTRPVYAGKALIDVKITSENKVITLRPNVFNPGEVNGAPAEIETKPIAEVSDKCRAVEIKKAEGKIDVAEADIIVSGGRGLKAPENFKMIADLADLLGAAQGASRAAVDAGWRPHSEQVGQTGKTVSPSLYIAIGISGAIQHMAGMRSSKYIVAINKDKDAPIFQVADYGIAGDAFEVVPALIEEIKKVKSE
ncbi:MAG: electron transfer flavoprotein subunit alpha/FixB family protein [Bacteroidetes bacterium]|nr:electron transfer flavoprotein subunit alpha/FixB family protein [Bacteroidota bacterium]MBU1680896.1 electron transfer flavoprotein subunit alpha/FixB family protein [Bacteroidota bacterium]MBU2507680.1 electron transfer flavoprotein subunit alpha/FixB family protein [Bacteroidota bacterium]